MKALYVVPALATVYLVILSILVCLEETKFWRERELLCEDCSGTGSVETTGDYLARCYWCNGTGASQEDK